MYPQEGVCQGGGDGTIAKMARDKNETYSLAPPIWIPAVKCKRPDPTGRNCAQRLARNRGRRRLGLSSLQSGTGRGRDGTGGSLMMDASHYLSRHKVFKDALADVIKLLPAVVTSRNVPKQQAANGRLRSRIT